MAVIEINRAAQTTEQIRIAKRAPPQIFIAHSSISKNLLANIERAITAEKVQIFIANRVRPGAKMADKITQAIGNSDALFAILTKNTLKKQSTRDWIFFEVGLVRGMWKNAVFKTSSQKKIYVWKDVTLKIPNTDPIQIIEEYRSVQLNSKKSRNTMLAEMKSIAHVVSMKNV